MPAKEHYFMDYKVTLQLGNRGNCSTWLELNLPLRHKEPLIFTLPLLYLLILGSKGWRSGESTRLPPVARVQISASTPSVGWVCYWFSPLLREVFLRVLRFSPLLKNQRFQIPIRPGIESVRRRTTMWMCYLQIVIYYLFNYSPPTVIFTQSARETNKKRISVPKLHALGG